MDEFKTAVTFDMSCVERELVRWLDTIGSVVPMCAQGANNRDFSLPAGGVARVFWQVLPDRVIALVRMKRLDVQIQFSSDVDEAGRAKFIKTFELYTLRGGG